MSLEEAIQDLAKAIRENMERRDKRLERMKDMMEQFLAKMKDAVPNVH